MIVLSEALAILGDTGTWHAVVSASLTRASLPVLTLQPEVIGPLQTPILRFVRAELPRCPPP